MLNLLMWCSLTVGRNVMAVVALFTALYFVVTSAKARNASRDYLQRVLPGPVKLRHIIKHFYTFARVSFDRLYILSGRNRGITTTFRGRENIEEKILNRSGVILLVAHMGSFEIMRVLGEFHTNIVINILMDRKHNQRAMDIIEKMDPELATRIIDANLGSIDIAMAIQARMNNHEMVGIMADRTLPGDDHSQCDFLGQSAYFPMSPWRLAVVLNVPIIMCAGLYQGRGHYELHFEIISEQFSAPRREREAVIRAGLEKYVEKLESFCRHSPYNWFNFYPFWSDEALKHH